MSLDPPQPGRIEAACPHPDAFRRVVECPHLGAVIRERVAQLDAHGHMPEADAELPLHALPHKALDYLQIALECTQGIRGQRDLPRARKKLAQAAALCLAALDRLDLPA